VFHVISPKIAIVDLSEGRSEPQREGTFAESTSELPPLRQGPEKDPTTTVRHTCPAQRQRTIHCPQFRFNV